MPSKRGAKTGRQRANPVQLIHFLRDDDDVTPPAQDIQQLLKRQQQNSSTHSHCSNNSHITNVSPIISGSSCPKNPWTANSNSDRQFNYTGPNEEEFPAVGAVRNRKTKLSKTPEPPLTPTESNMPLQEKTASTNVQKQSQALQQQRAGCLKKQQVVNKWLKSVQQPVVTAQSQLLPMLKTTSPAQSNVIYASAPPPRFSTHFKRSANNIPMVETTNTELIFSSRWGDSDSDEAAEPAQATPSQAMPAQLSDANVVDLNTEEPAVYIQQPMRQDINVNNATNRRNKPIFARNWIDDASNDMMEQDLDDMQSIESSQAPDADLSFMQELQQAIVGKEATPVADTTPIFESQTQSELQAESQLQDIASRSTLNFNAKEFRPSSIGFSQTEDIPMRAQQQPRNMLSERRRRQRFHRILKPHSLFELVTLPGQQEPVQLPALLPTPNIPPNYNYNFKSFHSTPKSSNYRGSQVTNNNSEAATQSVFRHASLPSTGIGTDSSGKDSASPPSTITTYDPGEMKFESSWHDAPIEMQQKENVIEQEQQKQEENTTPPPQLPRHHLFTTNDIRGAFVDLNLMPRPIQKLYRLICGKNSDFAFVFALSSQLCQEFIPMGYYVYLKMAMLASLASIELDELRPPISLCVLCNDTYIAHRLLYSVGQLAPRFVGPHNGKQQAVVSPLPAHHTWIAASPLILAQQGIYYVGDWNRLLRDQCEELEKCIENASVPLPPQRGEVNEQPLEASIWTYWQPENAANQTTAFAKLCPIFGLPLCMDEQVDEVLWDYTLRKFSENAPESDPHMLSIPDEHMREFLSLLQQRKVEFTPEAESLLRKYYLVSRQERSTVFTSKTYIVLKQFAESFAKLGMRLKVLEADVVVAIFHCEHFVVSVLGAGKHPPPAVIRLKVVSKVDKYMNEFARWLFEYLDLHDNNDLDASTSCKRPRFF